MRRLSIALAGESVLLLGLTATILTALHIEKEWQDVVQAAIPLLLALAVRQITSSPATVAAAVTEAAVDTARNINRNIAGAAGDVTDEALKVAGKAAGGVLERVGGLVPALIPDKRKVLDD